MFRALALSCWFSLVACGGSSHHSDQATPGGAAPGFTPESDDGSPAGSFGKSDGGAPAEPGGISHDPPSMSEPPVEAGGAADRSPLRPGTRYCGSEQDCLGLACLGYAASPTNICTAACQVDADCEAGLICFGEGELAPLCLQTCRAAPDCDYGFDCVHYLEQATFSFCLPSPWTEQFMQQQG